MSITFSAIGWKANSKPIAKPFLVGIICTHHQTPPRPTEFGLVCLEKFVGAIAIAHREVVLVLNGPPGENHNPKICKQPKLKAL